MINPGLLAEIEAAQQLWKAITRLSDDEATAILDRLAAAFIADQSSVWWWDALRTPGLTLHYGKENGLAVLAEVLAGKTLVLLLVTDDEAAPWPVYAGSPNDIIGLLGDCRYFEYALAAIDASWMIFDTHHNELVMTGTLAVGHSKQ